MNGSKTYAGNCFRPSWSKNGFVLREGEEWEGSVFTGLLGRFGNPFRIGSVHGGWTGCADGGASNRDETWGREARGRGEGLGVATCWC